MYIYRVIIRGREKISLQAQKYTSKIGNSSRIPNLASEIGALCHVFRDIHVFSAFPEATLLGATLGKALKMSISRNIVCDFFIDKSHPSP